MIHAIFLQYYAGRPTCKNNTSPKITLVYNSRYKKVLVNYNFLKIRYLLTILAGKTNQAKINCVFDSIFF
jgi:hypothetical protein